MKKLICFFKGHQRKVISISHYLDISYGVKNGYPSTTATFKCLRCGEIFYKNYYMMGYLKAEDLEGAKSYEKTSC